MEPNLTAENNLRKSGRQVASFIFTGLFFSLFFLMLWDLPFAHAARPKPEDASVSDQLALLESKVHILLENQKTLTDNQEEIKKQLNSLRIWINRRR